jgi:fatty-acyl-CoA synthase
VLVEVDDVGDGAAPPVGVHEWAAFLARAEPVPHAERPSTDLFMFYTGGTTGLPKGVLRPATTEVMRVVAPEAVYDTRTSLLGLMPPYDVALAPPVTLVACPLMHGVGFTWTSLPSLSVGGTVVLLESRSFDPDELIDVAAARHATFVSLVGDAFVRPLLRALGARQAAGTLPDLSSIERVCSAGVAWHGDAKAQLLDFLPGATLIEGCGSDGGNYGISYTRRGEVPRTGTFERVPGTLVLRDDGTEAEVGEIGRLAAISHSPGYHKDRERTARVHLTIHGLPYVVPGDYGRIEADGTLTLIGRGTSTINTGGEKVHPEEVEAVLAAHPAVEDCMVFGMPDERLGETVTAIVQLRHGAACDGGELVDHLKLHLAAYKVPRRVVDGAVPRFANGKLDYPSARALAAETTR